MRAWAKPLDQEVPAFVADLSVDAFAVPFSTAIDFTSAYTIQTSEPGREVDAPSRYEAIDGRASIQAGSMSRPARGYNVLKMPTFSRA